MKSPTSVRRHRHPPLVARCLVEITGKLAGTDPPVSKLLGIFYSLISGFFPPLVSRAGLVFVTAMKNTAETVSRQSRWGASFYSGRFRKMSKKRADLLLMQFARLVEGCSKLKSTRWKGNVSLYFQETTTSSSDGNIFTRWKMYGCLVRDGRLLFHVRKKKKKKKCLIHV